MSKNTISVFITGATGYIGGQVLYELLNYKSQDFKITAMVRTETKGQNLKKATQGKVDYVVGSLDDTHLIENEVAKSDIVINTADVDHLASAKAIERAIVGKSKETILIHTSGTSVIGDALKEGKGPSKKVYYDDANIDEINNLALDQPHRPVDKLILDLEEKSEKVKSVIICPSTIFGVSNGYDKIISVQIPFLLQASAANGQAFSVYDGKYIWSHIHIKDLGQMYILCIEKLLKGEKIPRGRNGYYFGSYFFDEEESISDKPSSIEHYWCDVSRAIAHVLFDENIISTKDVKELNPESIAKITNVEFAPFYWGTNSRSRGNNARSIGWKPQYSNSHYFWDSIKEDLQELKKEGKI